MVSRYVFTICQLVWAARTSSSSSNSSSIRANPFAVPADTVRVSYNRQAGFLDQHAGLAITVRDGHMASYGHGLALIPLQHGLDMEDALTRCFSYVKAGADGIMIHSRKKGPEEIFEFCRRFRSVERDVPLVVVPTTFNTVTEAEFAAAGVNIVIHANHMIRSAFPSMQRCAEMILEHGRSWEAGSICMPIGQILTLIKDT